MLFIYEDTIGLLAYCLTMMFFRFIMSIYLAVSFCWLVILNVDSSVLWSFFLSIFVVIYLFVSLNILCVNFLILIDEGFVFNFIAQGNGNQCNLHLFYACQHQNEQSFYFPPLLSVCNSERMWNNRNKAFQHRNFIIIFRLACSIK